MKRAMKPTHTLTGFGDERDGKPVTVLNTNGVTALVDASNYRARISVDRLAPLMNAQTPGPVIASNPHPGQFALVPVNHTKQPDFWTLAYIRDFQSNDRDNAALFAAAYTSFDKAGRELGIDATKLAESIDMPSLINTLRALINLTDNVKSPYTRRNLNLIIESAKREISRLPKRTN